MEGVTLLWPPSAPELPERQQIWAELMASNFSLEECICSDAKWEATDIPMRYGH